MCKAWVITAMFRDHSGLQRLSFGMVADTPLAEAIATTIRHIARVYNPDRVLVTRWE